MSDKGVGARLARKEDRRFLLGQGEYVANIRLPGMLEVAFVRSPVAHARWLAPEAEARTGIVSRRCPLTSERRRGGIE